MSKSYGKYKTIGVWYEAHANTEYYRCRRRSFRTKNRHIIRNMLANKSITDFDELYTDFRQHKKNHWEEPTDGTFKLYHGDLIKYKSIYKYNGIYPTKNNRIKK